MEKSSYAYRTTRLVLHNCLAAVAEFVSHDDTPPAWDAVLPHGLPADPVDRLGIDPAYLARVGEACRRLRRHLPDEGYSATLEVRVPHADDRDPVMFTQRAMLPGGHGLELTMLVAPKRL